jgi:transcriptional regulator with XRE-family HTH domain
MSIPHGQTIFTMEDCGQDRFTLSSGLDLIGFVSRSETRYEETPMQTTLDYLNAAKQALGIDSDYALAKWLGVTKQSASNWKNGKNIIDDYAAAKIADALGLDPLEVIAVANMERSEQKQEKERRDYWRKIFKRCAAAIVVFFLYLPGGWSSEANSLQSDNSIYYAQSDPGAAARLAPVWPPPSREIIPFSRLTVSLN